MSLFTAANQLTLLRLLLVPVVALCLLYGWLGWALVAFLVAAVTDLFDGLLARQLGQHTTLGAWLDPMADKLLVLTTMIMLTIPGLGFANRLPLWLTVAVISRDVAIVLTVAIFNLAIGRRTFRPSMLGKVATAVYVFTGVCALCGNYLGERWLLVDAAVYASLGLTLASAAHYAWRGTRAD